MDSANTGSSFSSASKISGDQANMLNSNALSGGLLTGAFDGSLYTCMHQMEFLQMLVVGTGNGSLRWEMHVDVYLCTSILKYLGKPQN